jgi:hypothetical protein
MIYVRPPVADLKAEPASKAERISQLLCFTPCEPLREVGGFLLVQGPDGYQGWIRRSHIVEGDLPDPNFKVSQPIAPVIDPSTREVISRLPLDARFRGEVNDRGVEVRLPTGELGIVPLEAVRPIAWRGTIEDLLAVALSLRGVPYLWGGTTPFGFDCSGLVQRLFHFVFDLWLPRDSRDQMEVGDPVGLAELKPGDLLFFPGHVALWVGRGMILHASAREGTVVLTSFDQLYEKPCGGRRLLARLP